MTGRTASTSVAEPVFDLALALNRTESVESAVDRTVARLSEVFDCASTGVFVWRLSATRHGEQRDAASARSAELTRSGGAIDAPPADRSFARLPAAAGPRSTAGIAGPRRPSFDQVEVDSGPDVGRNDVDLVRSELLCGVGDERVIGIASTERGAFDAADRRVLTLAVDALEAAVARLCEPAQVEATNATQAIEFDAFQRAIDEAADGVAILEDDEYVYVDRTHVEMYGFDSKAQLLGDTWEKLYDTTEVERLKAEAFPVLERDGQWRGRVTGCRPDGSTFPVEISLTVVDGGRIICTARDRTEARKRERELELKERAMDEADIAIQITDPTQAGNPLVYVNEGFERLTGYDESEVLGENPRFLQSEATESRQLQELREAVEAERPVTVELENVTADGEPYWARLSVAPVHDEDGRLTNFIGIQQDVTERRELLRTLKDRTERLELVLSETETGIAEWDLDTERVRWDETLVDTFGQDPETLAEFWSIVHPEDRERTRDEFETMLETGEPSSGAFRVFTGDGDVAWLETRAVAMRNDDDTPHKVLATGADVTEQTERTQWLYDLFDYGPLMFLRTRIGDGGAIVEECDPSFADRLGYDREAVRGEPLSAFYDDESTDDLQTGGYAEALDGELTVVERQLVDASGEPVPCLLRAVPREIDGRAVGTDVLLIDITEQKQRERALSSAKAQYQTMLRAAPDPVFVVDPASGEVLEANTAAATLLETPLDELVEGHYTDLFPASERDQYRTLFEGGTDGPVSTLPNGRQTRLVTGAGETVPVETNLTTVELDDGPVTYGAFRDISERKKYTRRLEAVFNGTVQLTGLVDPDGTIVSINDATVAFTGTGRDQLVGSHLKHALWTDAGTEADFDVDEAIRQAAAGEPVRRETELRGTDRIATVDFSVKPVQADDGDVTLLVVEGNDITAQKQQQQHLQVLQRVMRHNIRNDLNALRGWTNLLADEDDPDRRAAHLDRVERGFDRWERIAENIHRIEQAIGTQPADVERVPAATLTRRVVDDRRDAHPAATIGVHADDVRGTLPRLIDVPLGELIDNAVQAHPDEDPTVDVTVTRRDSGWLQVAVTDDGPGMPPMEASVLETGEESPLSHGSGLGVWTVRMVVTHFGGDVEVETAADGTRVVLWIPTSGTSREDGHLTAHSPTGASHS
jgi:PAS domain S-box-containing protein